MISIISIKWKLWNSYTLKGVHWLTKNDNVYLLLMYIFIITLGGQNIIRVILVEKAYELRG